MPLYTFECKHGHVTQQYRPLSKYVERIKCPYTDASSRCGARASICISRVQICVFKPYVEKNMTSEPIRIETKEQRDALCEKHKVTYDSVKYVRVQKESAVDSLTLDAVHEAIQTERLPDGSKLDLSTVVDSETIN